MILRIKKYLMIIAAILAAFFVALAKAFFLGKKTEQKKQTEKALKAAKTRLKVENEINKKSDANVRNELSDWFAQRMNELLALGGCQFI
ncbi:hypothetical protein [Bartonella quintana]|uniref:Uncharacterized protein n=2 Tax=Bartonella quintana TaxID=803 RepID=W3TYD6_BARQI|nr:hypothetical protein [Bartonella quintana]ETS13414.1 hypothetical protein Q651_00371 [Bartonella quintana BQ2-D70]ETS13927.1 hypothetical protein Q650_00543 [Bartonella quintana JK 73rel]ETS15614.1 hypothetical protein Q649_00552 [Bartonella quintana JK 73]ETS17618.1 hypothetical protein Q647_00542 [Bartonella quintana JK 7]ETS18448.1 hypothetical protein Q648_00132 [Bartonella quintana JK 12]